MKHSRPATRLRRAEPAGNSPAPIPLRAVPMPRPSRVATARARIALDYYDRPDVRERVVEALLTELKQR